MQPRKKRFTKPAIVALALAAAVASLIGLRASQANKEPEKKKDDAARIFELAPGDVARLERVPLGRRIPVSGSVMPVLQATVRAKVAAEVQRVHAQEGEAVKAGAVLASLERADLAARRDAQLAAVAEARARLDLARKNVANQEALLQKGFISQNAYDSVANAMQVAQANLQSATAQAAIAERALADAEVRAPFDGIVARRFVNVGDKVSADAPVAQVVDLARMELEAQVPVAEVPYVKVGQQVAFHVDGFPGRPFTGKVERINPAAEPGSRSISVFLQLPNRDGSLKGGMFASGTLAAEGAEAEVIPLAAVQEEGGQKFVLVVKDGRVERRSVTVGTASADTGLVPVREGLESGVHVITVRAEGLKPGAKAVLKPAAPARSS